MLKFAAIIITIILLLITTIIPTTMAAAPRGPQGGAPRAPVPRPSPTPGPTPAVAPPQVGGSVPPSSVGSPTGGSNPAMSPGSLGIQGPYKAGQFPPAAMARINEGLRVLVGILEDQERSRTRFRAGPVYPGELWASADLPGYGPPVGPFLSVRNLVYLDLNLANTLSMDLLRKTTGWISVIG